MTFFPDNYKTSDERKLQDTLASGYFNAKALAKGGSVDIRLCGTAASGHVIAGYQYFTSENRPRRSPLWPEHYDDIGMNFEKTGKAVPSFFMSCVAFIDKHPKPIVFEVAQQMLIQDLEMILNRADYSVEPGKIANFYITVEKTEKNNKIQYSAIPTLKALPEGHPAYAAWEESAGSIWLPALFEGGDPFAGAPAGGGTARPGIPLTTRDELGADHETAEAAAAGTW